MEETNELPTDAPEPRPDVRLLRSITLNNVLSFGPQTPPLELRALNVLIGPNGSGKSNLLAAIDLLKSTADSLDLGLAAGEDFVWKGAAGEAAICEATTRLPFAALTVVHQLKIEEIAPVTFRLRERVSRQPVPPAVPDLFPYFESDGKAARIRANGHSTVIPLAKLNPDASVLAQFRDPLQYPELTDLGEAYQRIRIFRDWGFGNFNSPRRPQRTDVRNDFPAADGSNLGLVLNKLRRNTAVKAQLLAGLNELYEGVTDFDVAIEGGYAQVYLQEGNFSMPAARLSDGTLRYLFLLAVLLHPTPPPLICLEEPELGLHPHAVVAIGRLIKEASERTQLVVTTHSDILLDMLGGNPEDVIVCEKHAGQTEMTRLSADELRGWLERYSLSQLWTRGKLGGNRW